MEDCESFCSWHCPCKVLLPKVLSIKPNVSIRRPQDDEIQRSVIENDEGLKKEFIENNRKKDEDFHNTPEESVDQSVRNNDDLLTSIPEQKKSPSEKANLQVSGISGGTTPKVLDKPILHSSIKRKGQPVIHLTDCSKVKIKEKSFESNGTLKLDANLLESSKKEVKSNKLGEKGNKVDSIGQPIVKSDPKPIVGPGPQSAYNCRNRSIFHKCSSCGKRFHNPTSLKWHEKEHLLESPRPIECVECEKTYTSLARYQSHLKSHTKCLLCGITITSKDKEYLESNELTVNTCRKCINTDNSSSRKGRFAMKLVEMEKDEIQDKDQELGAELEEEEQQQVLNPDDAEMDEYDFEEINQERKPNSKLLDKRELIFHAAEERPFKCPKCPARFKHPHHVSRHQLVHSGEKPHGCDLCGQTFNQRFRLKNHVIGFHKVVWNPNE